MQSLPKVCVGYTTIVKFVAMFVIIIFKSWLLHKQYFYKPLTYKTYHKIPSIKSKSAYYNLSLTVVQVCIMLIKCSKMMLFFSWSMILYIPSQDTEFGSLECNFVDIHRIWDIHFERKSWKYMLILLFISRHLLIRKKCCI